MSARKTRERRKKTRSSRQEGLFRQVAKTIGLLLENPRHPSLQTHPYDSLEPPKGCSSRVFEAYAQNRTPSAYRVFWCYGPAKGQITIIAVTRHP
jgi:hypothetical protein